MAKPAARPKSRRTHYVTATPEVVRADKGEGAPTTAAPAHNGGIFTNAGPYLPSGRGVFGFRQTS